MDTCVKCGMPVDDDSKCSCDPSLCFHCCACPPDCSCGCSNMIDNSAADEEDELDEETEDEDEMDEDEDEEDEY